MNPLSFTSTLRLAGSLALLVVTGCSSVSSKPKVPEGRIASVNLIRVYKSYGPAQRANVEMRRITDQKKVAFKEQANSVSAYIHESMEVRSSVSKAELAQRHATAEKKYAELQALQLEEGRFLREMQSNSIAKDVKPIAACVAKVAKQLGYSLVLDSAKEWAISTELEGGQAGVVYQSKPKHLDDLQILELLPKAQDITQQVIDQLPR